MTVPNALKDVPRCDGVKTVAIELTVNVTTHDAETLFTDQMLGAAFQQVVNRALETGGIPSTIGYGKSRGLALVGRERPAIFVAVKGFRVHVGTPEEIPTADDPAESPPDGCSSPS